MQHVLVPGGSIHGKLGSFYGCGGGGMHFRGPGTILFANVGLPETGELFFGGGH